MTGAPRGRMPRHPTSAVSLGSQTHDGITPGMFLLHAVAAVEGAPPFDTPLVPAEGRAGYISVHPSALLRTPSAVERLFSVPGPHFPAAPGRSLGRQQTQFGVFSGDEGCPCEQTDPISGPAGPPRTSDCAKRSQFAEPPCGLGVNCTNKANRVAQEIVRNKANSRHGVRRGKGFAGKELW
jgi:hypothetical protein